MRYKQDEERKIRSTYAWTKKARTIRDTAQYLCEVCRAKGIYTYKNLEVHHIEKLRDRKDLTFDDDNLILLCQEHHKQAESGEISKDYLRSLVKDIRNSRVIGEK